mmetsp:Transcript_45414/g.95186  ORF Transcript_45414/g.95186 Transcript_45414/m.95186 type:complete len:256 (+) Transcript_45414:145-912(+)
MPPQFFSSPSASSSVPSSPVSATIPGTASACISISASTTCFSPSSCTTLSFLPSTETERLGTLLAIADFPWLSRFSSVSSSTSSSHSTSRSISSGSMSLIGALVFAPDTSPSTLSTSTASSPSPWSSSRSDMAGTTSPTGPAFVVSVTDSFAGDVITLPDPSFHALYRWRASSISSLVRSTGLSALSLSLSSTTRQIEPLFEIFLLVFPAGSQPHTMPFSSAYLSSSHEVEEWRTTVFFLQRTCTPKCSVGCAQV